MKFLIRGGKKLEGEIKLQGAKNAATKLMVASLLTEEPCRLDNFPRIGDTDITAEFLKHIGSKVVRNGSTVTIETTTVKNSRVTLEQSRRNRIPILALGPLLARVGEAEVPFLGGDKIGARPVNLHIKALEALGAEIEIEEGKCYRARAKHGLRGAEIRFDFPSVGATENAILAAVLAKGKTVLRNAALEPEIMSVVKMLQKMGAIIELGANRDFYIEGVPRLRGARHKVLPDRNEAVSFACLAIATGGRILVKDAIQDHLITFLNTVRRLGAEYEISPEGIAFWRPSVARGSAGTSNSLRPLEVETAIHPGFMTDWQQPLAVLLTQVEGTSTIHETIYDNRFGYTDDLKRMGAKIEVGDSCPPSAPCRFSEKNFPHVATIHGSTPLRGAKMVVRDLRAGIVNVIAALVANGDSEIDGVEEIDRGYERIDERLRNLGAHIERV
ncbi:MAG: UDP-N-acetylglucosamine 1-carboxyvinyltransferase [Candidatus Liptonbacteria bacterium]|nr:UDP-N-acetylglucosamine 1-carboxyvinyltransferase [Candidatus Liptonbacteria bacterium]